MDKAEPKAQRQFKGRNRQIGPVGSPEVNRRSVGDAQAVGRRVDDQLDPGRVQPDHGRRDVIQGDPVQGAQQPADLAGCSLAGPLALHADHRVGQVNGRLKGGVEVDQGPGHQVGRRGDDVNGPLQPAG